MSIKRWLNDIRFRLTHGGDMHLVSADDEGLTLQKNGRTIKRLRWDDIDEIYAEKKDGLTIELIFVVFHAASEGTVCVEELDSGFQSVISDMERRFPAFNRSWYGELNSGKPFEPRTIEIWKKAI